MGLKMDKLGAVYVGLGGDEERQVRESVREGA
jgi:hypothetical protein